MISVLDITSTFGAAVMLLGTLRPDAPGWRAGAVGACAHVVAATALVWLVTRLWTLQVGLSA